MKLNQLLSETEINEFDVPIIGKRAQSQRMATKKFNKNMDSEVSKMESELKNFMRASQIKVATPQVVLDYLNKKGLGKAGKEVVKSFVTGTQKFQNVAHAAGKIVGKAFAKPTAQGQPQSAPQDASEPPPANKLSAAQKAKALQWQRSRFNEQVEMDAPLSARDVRNMLKQAAEKGYAMNPSFGKSQFASDTDSTPTASASQQKPKFPADVVSAVSKLSAEQRKQLAQVLQR